MEHEETACKEEVVKTNSSKFAIFSVVKSDLIMLHMHVASYIGWKLFAIDFQ